MDYSRGQDKVQEEWRQGSSDKFYQGVSDRTLGDPEGGVMWRGACRAGAGSEKAWYV